MPLLKILLICPVLWLSLSPAQAQDVYAFDDKIDRFVHARQRDSALYYMEAKAMRYRQGDKLDLWAWVLLDAHDFLSDLGDEPAALAYLDKISREKWREPAAKDEYEPFCYEAVNQAAACRDAGRMLQAIERFEWAEKIYTQYRYPDFAAVETIYKPLGNCYTRLGADDKALAVFMKAMQIGGDNETLAGLYGNIGIALWNKNDLKPAEDFLRQGLALPGISVQRKAQLLGTLAITLLSEQRKQEAYATARASLKLIAGSPESVADKANQFTALTTAAEASSDPAESGRLLAAARQDAMDAYGPHSRELGKLEISRALWLFRGKKYTSAMDAANRALQVVLPRFAPAKTSDNPDITQFYEENVISEALRLKALAAAAEYEINGRMETLQLAFDCHELAWQAEALLRKTYQYNSSKLMQQSSSWENEQAAMQVTRRLYEKTGDRKYVDKAMEIAERNKAAVLRDAVNDNLITQHLAATDERFQQLASLRGNFSYFERQLLLDPENPQAVQWRVEADALQTQIKQLEAQLKAAYPLLTPNEPEGVAGKLQPLHPQETVLEYFVGKGATEVFLLMQGQPAIWKSFPTPQSLIASYMAYFNDQNAILSNPAGFLDVAWQLWQQLIPPEARQSKQLLIIPDGVLNNIPFDALVTEAVQSGATLRNAPYLIRKQEVHYAWSLAVLASQKKLVSRAPNYALTLAPRFQHNEQGMAPLEFNPEEGPAGSKLKENQAASWQVLSNHASQYRMLHLATHAFAGDSSDHGTRLVLSDRQVWLPDIYGLSLQADLVTLSACETALGKRLEGEGVMSFARAFAQAGAACVVSSQWSVNDRSTGRLLADFYRQLDQGISIGAALRQAKLNYLSDAAVPALAQSPYFWAGLTMIGDDRSVVEDGWSNWWWAGALFLFVALLILWKLRKMAGSVKGS